LDFLEDRTVALVTSDRWGGLPGTPWWNVMAKSGGQLVEQTTHQVDMIRCLAGEIVEVYSVAALRTLDDVPGLDIPDVQALTFRMENGAIGSLTTSCALNKGGDHSNLDIMVKDAVLHWSHDSLSATPEEDPPLGDDIPATSSIDEVFIRAVRTQDGSEIRSPYRDALRTLDVTLAANESARTGKPVETLLSA
jgi:predicted dehydrogenase